MTSRAKLAVIFIEHSKPFPDSKIMKALNFHNLFSPLQNSRLKLVVRWRPAIAFSRRNDVCSRACTMTSVLKNLALVLESKGL